MACTWAIDTLDARGGLAFASYRTFNLSDEGNRLLEAPCVWIAPPYFEPEPVVSRALAWSADRGAFQLGVFLDGNEVRFETIEALTEFVRRTYLRSAGGDEPEGGVSPLPLPHPPDITPGLRLPILREGPDERFESDFTPIRPSRSGGGAGSEIDVLQMLRAFEVASRTQTKFITGIPVRWIGQNDDVTSFATPSLRIGELLSARDQLGWASLLLIHELLLRLPQVPQSAELLAWQRSARTLGKILTEFGVWSWLMLGPYSSELRDWAKYCCVKWERIGHLSERTAEYIINNPQGFIFFYAYVFDGAVIRSAWTHDDISWFYDLPFIWTMAHNSRVNDDPVADLGLLPLPSTLALCVRQGKNYDVNVFQLLSAVSGSPLCLCNGSNNDRDGVAILLFAAGWLLQSKDKSYSLANEALDNIYSFRFFQILETERINDLVEQAWAWLAKSMPHLAFPSAIEAMIAEASSLRYGGEPGPETSTSPPQSSPPGGGSGAVDEVPVENLPEAPTVFQEKNDESQNYNESTQTQRPRPMIG